MVYEPFYILKNKTIRLFFLENAFDIKEKCSSGIRES